jgi:phosphoribosyl isomerase A
MGRVTLLPAVDVAGGRAIRVARGEIASGTVHGDPLELARSLQADGAEWIHLVDLDAAFGRGSNASLLATVIDRLDVDVELAGGIVDDASLAQALGSGCARVVLGTAAQDRPDWCARVIGEHGDRIAVGLDVRVIDAGDGSLRHRLAARGGRGDNGDLWDAIARSDRAGCRRYVVTDVSTDGMLQGPNLDLYRAVAAATDTPVIASGGISSIDDLVALRDLAAHGVDIDGVILGAALAADRFTLSEARAALQDRE